MSVYAVSDLHGCYDMWKNIEEFLRPEDELYVLGDVIDRGGDGFLIYEEMLHHDNIHFLKGNHEWLAELALPHLMRGDINHKDVQFWFYPENGGQWSWDFIKDESDEYKQLFIDFFAQLPTSSIYINKNDQCIYLDHCGFTPHKECYILEDRNHFKDPYISRFWRDWEDVIIVHGHTPVDSLFDYFGYYTDKNIDTTDPYKNKQRSPHKITEMITYCEGHKIDIDMGLPWTHVCCLLDLDTLKPFYFETP